MSHRLGKPFGRFEPASHMRPFPNECERLHQWRIVSACYFNANGRPPLSSGDYLSGMSGRQPARSVTLRFSAVSWRAPTESFTGGIEQRIRIPLAIAVGTSERNALAEHLIRLPRPVNLLPCIVQLLCNVHCGTVYVARLWNSFAVYFDPFASHNRNGRNDATRCFPFRH
jgi:hypothetical protein